MCVTNTTGRRHQSVSLASLGINSSNSGDLARRLYGSMPLQSVSTPKQAPVQNDRPKRRRKPQKPGKTAKMNDRHFVVHNYHDHALDKDETDVGVEETIEEQRRRGGVAVAFPIKLHAVLDQVAADGLQHVVSWQAHGRCFVIHNPKEFVDHIMPKYFRQTKLTSFQRQLNLYGFNRITRGADAGGYYHELFLRGMEFLCKKMIRTKVKGTRFKAASSPDQEPDFYKMDPVIVSPQNTSDEESQGTYETFDSSINNNYSTQQQQYEINNNNMMIMNYLHQQQQAQAAMQQQAMNATIYDPLPVSFNMNNNYCNQQQQQLQFELNEESEADRVLDEAVDELFLSNNGGDIDGLADFVHDWNPDFDELAANCDTDLQLGYLLDKLLEE